MKLPSTISEHKRDEFLVAASAALSKGDSVFTFEFNQYAVLSEGILDRIRARAAGAAGTVKGAVKTAHGAALTMKGALGKDKSNIGKGAELIRQGSISGATAKAKSIKKTALNRLDSTLNDILNDVKRLGIEWHNSDGDTSPQEIIAERFKVFRAATEEVFNEIVFEIDDTSKKQSGKK